MEEEKSLFSPGMEAFFAREKQDKLMRYRHLNRFCKKGQIVLAGSSLMEQFPIYELMQDFDLPLTIYNRGIGGYVSRDMLAALDVQVLELAPSKLFINIGTNDIGNIELLCGSCNQRKSAKDEITWANENGRLL